MSDLQSQVDILQNRVSKAGSQLQKYKGKLEAAKQAKTAVESECEKKKIKPAKIDQLRNQLQQKFDKESLSLTKTIEKVENSLEEFQEA